MRRLNTFALAGLVVAALGTATSSHGQNPQTSVVERGMHFRTWQSIQASVDSAGRQVLTTNGWTECGQGICYVDATGQWQDSQDLIEINAVSGGAVARHGPVQATLASTVTGGVSLNSPAGVHLQARVLGVYYADPATGRSALVAAVKDAPGTLYPPNTAVYDTCFDGVKASVRYVYTAGLFDQTVVFLEPLPAPESFGFSSNSCQVQVRTAFQASVAPQVRVRTINTSRGPQSGPSGAAANIVDQVLTFGDLWFPTGAAFGSAEIVPSATNQPIALRLYSAADTNAVLVAKQWIPSPTGDSILVESINWQDLASRLVGLPKTAALPGGGASTAARAGGGFLAQAASGELRHFGPTPNAHGPARSADRGFLVSAVPYTPEGVVLDWTTVYIGGSYTSFTFSNNWRYGITSSLYLGGGNVAWQPNSVLKFKHNTYLLVYGQISFPATGNGPGPVFTSYNDNTFGDTLSGSTGSPAQDASQELWLYYPPSGNLTVENARFRWAQRAIQYDQNPGVYLGPYLHNCSLENCGTGIYLNGQNDTLYLYGVTSCTAYNQTTTPLYISSGYSSGGIARVANANVSQRLGSEQETTVAVNPTNPNNIVVVSNSGTVPGLWRAVSFDGGLTWPTEGIILTSTTPLPGSSTDCSSWCDPSVAFDSFGNCFLAYAGVWYMHLVLSTDGGQNFSTVVWEDQDDPTVYNGRSGTTLTDYPRVAVGPRVNGQYGSVWVVYGYYYKPWDMWFHRVAGATVTGLGQVGNEWGSCPTYTSHRVTGSGNCQIADIAIGPAGQVLLASVLWPTGHLWTFTNPNGVSNQSSWDYHDIGLSSFYYYYFKCSPDRKTFGNPFIAFDQRPTGGRAYMVYPQWYQNGSLIGTVLRAVYSDDGGGTWSSSTPINDDGATGLAHLYPSVAVDQASGKVGVCWYDCRNDPNNQQTQCFGTVSSNGGVNWSQNFLIGPGPSNAYLLSPSNPMDYGDYTGLAYYNGILTYTWADNSNCTYDNPDFKNGNNQMDVYISRRSQ